MHQKISPKHAYIEKQSVIINLILGALARLRKALRLSVPIEQLGSHWTYVHEILYLIIFRLHNEELHDLYSSPTIVRVIKSKRMRWAGQVARIGREAVCTGFWWENRRERDHFVDLSVDGMIILRRIFRKWDVGVWTGVSWLRIETGGGHL
jgi:hypothetical protein